MNKLPKKPNNVKDLAFGMATYTGASILGPLVLFIAIGYGLDYLLNTKPLMIIIGVLGAFALTNLLIYRKIRKLMKDFDQMDKQNSRPEKKDAEQKPKA